MVRADLLVLLDERRAKAAVAWQYVTRYRNGTAHPEAMPLQQAFPGVWYSPAEWMALAGLSAYDHDHVAPFLFRAGAVDAGGGVSDEASTYARRMVAARLGRLKRDERDRE